MAEGLPGWARTWALAGAVWALLPSAAGCADDNSVLGGSTGPSSTTTTSVTTTSTLPATSTSAAPATTSPASTTATTTTTPADLGLAWARIRAHGAFAGPDDQEMLDAAAGGPGLVAVGMDSPHDHWDAAA